MDFINELGERYTALHLKIHDADIENQMYCKSTCGLFEGGISHVGEVPEYFFRFGGYCIGNCDRWHEISAPTIEKLKEAFDKIEQG